MYDKESIEKAHHSAQFLVQDLKEMTQSQNPLLADIAIELLDSAAKLETRLGRLHGLVAVDGDTRP